MCCDSNVAICQRTIGLRYEGGRMVDMYRTLDSIRFLQKAGGILVMTDEIQWNRGGKRIRKA